MVITLDSQLSRLGGMVHQDGIEFCDKLLVGVFSLNLAVPSNSGANKGTLQGPKV